MKKVSLSTLITSLIVAACVSVSLTLISVQVFGNNDAASVNLINKLGKIDNLLKTDFYGEYDANLMVDNALKSYVRSTGDKYAEYMPTERAEEYTHDLDGVKTGVGINATEHPETKAIFVRNIHSLSPADKAGLQVGDQIVMIDGQSVLEIGYKKSYDLLKKQIGDEVNLEILRGGETIEKTLIYEKFDLQSVFNQAIGDFSYIKITDFNGKTPQQFQNAVDESVAGGFKGLIFDLRGNGGGTVESAAQMIDYLVPKGDIISVKYKSGETETMYKSEDGEVNLPMCVLTDGNTASASELFTASLRDYNKAVSIGQKTFGKGIMQRTFDLGDGSKVKFTVGEYFCPNGESIHGVGILPDIEILQTNEEIKANITGIPENDSVIIEAVKYLSSQIL
ncbi:MAG: S41 family peptidase [Oscillospiraceae bacterium]